MSLQRFGVEIARYRPSSARRLSLMRSAGIATVLDVGANRGQYAQELRASGYDGSIISFEPLPDVYPTLRERAAHDSRWTTYPFALSDHAGTAALQVTENRASSSLHKMLPLHEKAAPSAAVIGEVAVELRRLDDVLESSSLQGRLMLKLDVQGHELLVLSGASETLGKTSLMEVEVSVLPLYSRQPLLHDVLDAMRVMGFRLVALEPGFYDPSDGTILQFDALFSKSEGS